MKVCWAIGCTLVAVCLTLGATGGGTAGGDTKKTKGDLDAFFKKLDTNMDGKLTKEEFVRMAERAKEKDNARKKLSQAFDKLDPEKKGVSKDQLKKYLLDAKKGEAGENGSK